MNVINPAAGAITPAGELRKDGQKDLKKTASEFEALFINQMLQSMRQTVMKSDLFHGGSGEDVYLSLMDAELSKVMAEGGGIGLQKVLMEQLSKAYGGNGAMEAPPDFKIGPAETAPDNDSAQPMPEIRVPQEGQSPFRLPVHGRVSSAYGMRTDPVTGDYRFHHGVDIAAREGTTVYPAAPGKVIFSGEKGGYGNVVEIQHDNGVVTRYGHNSANLVRAGDVVGPADPIANVGSTGRSTGPHLHFEVIKNGGSVDPATLIAGKLSEKA